MEILYFGIFIGMIVALILIIVMLLPVEPDNTRKALYHPDYDDPQDLIFDLVTLKSVTGLCRREKKVIDEAIAYIEGHENE